MTEEERKKLELEQQKKPNPPPYSQQLNEMYNQLQNRRFNYDMNADQEWQNYKNLWAQQGRKAMQDTIGQINASTGGYGNSYAGAVGQQQYQNHIQQMMGALPTFSQQAFDRYTQEGNELRQNAQLGMDQMQNAYAMAMDQLKNGITPDENLLKMAGLTSEQAQKLLKPKVVYSDGGKKQEDQGFLATLGNNLNIGLTTLLGGLNGMNMGGVTPPGIKSLMDQYNYNKEDAELLDDILNDGKKKK